MGRPNRRHSRTGQPTAGEPRLLTWRPFATAALALALGAGCGAEDLGPTAQPAPDVTTFQPGRFDDLPLYPRSDPVGPRTDAGGVAARSYRTIGTTAREVLEFYRNELPETWHLVHGIEELGESTYRADWSDGTYRLRVSATREPTLDIEDNASPERVVQYSLTLRPL